MNWRPKLLGGGEGRVRKTLLLNLSMIGLVAGAVLFLLLGAAIDKTFGKLEERDLQGHIGRFAEFQKTTLRSLTARSKDWGVWDDSFRYALDFNSRYEADNVNIESFQNALVDGLAIVRFHDGAAKAFAFDRDGGQALPELAAALRKHVIQRDFVDRMHKHADAQNFIALGGQLYSIASVQIRKSDSSGTPPGFLTFIQKVTSDKADEALQVATDIKLDRSARQVGRAMIDKHANSIEVTAPFEGADGKTVAAIHLHLKRPLTVAAKELLGITFAGVFLLIVALLAVLSRRIRTLVLGPVERLHRHVSHIRESGELQTIDATAPNNEFGALQTEFNRMTTELQQLRAQLESQSFTLGKSQSAIGLMHNLRNSLSPVRVILDTLSQSGGGILPAQASRALKELSDGTLEQERRTKLVDFLSVAHEHAGAQEAMMRQQVREAARNLMNALDAIDTAAQGQRDTRFDERCDLSGLLSHSANVARYAEDADIEVDVQCDGHIAAAGNRVLLSQVLENLVANALEAIRENGGKKGAITLWAAQDRVLGDCTIRVVDNGAGFDPALAVQLFERGFSTRTSKSGGLGLHWCANTVRAMNGELRLESDGSGKGARAFINLPLWQDDNIGDQEAA